MTHISWCNVLSKEIATKGGEGVESQNGKEERNKNNTPTKIPSASTIQRLLHPITPLIILLIRSSLGNSILILLNRWIGSADRVIIALIIYDPNYPASHLIGVACLSGRNSNSPYGHAFHISISTNQAGLCHHSRKHNEKDGDEIH